MRPVSMPPSVASRMPMYPPGAPGLVGQQLFYGQAPPALIPPQVNDVSCVIPLFFACSGITNFADVNKRCHLKY